MAEEWINRPYGKVKCPKCGETMHRELFSLHINIDFYMGWPAGHAKSQNLPVEMLVNRCSCGHSLAEFPLDSGEEPRFIKLPEDDDE